MIRSGEAITNATSCLQKSVAPSFIAPKYLAIAKTTNTIEWLQNVLEKLKVPQKRMKLYQETFGVI